VTKREKIRYIAIALSLAYTAVRFVFVNTTLSGYGVNPWLFLIIDTVAGVVYVLGVERLIVALSPKARTAWPRMIGWSALTGVAFAAPYLYIYASSHELPLSFALGLSVIIILLLVNACVSIMRSVRSTR
jgi:hypothetical protein